MNSDTQSKVSVFKLQIPVIKPRSISVSSVLVVRHLVVSHSMYCPGVWASQLSKCWDLLSPANLLNKDLIGVTSRGHGCHMIPSRTWYYLYWSTYLLGLHYVWVQIPVMIERMKHCSPGCLKRIHVSVAGFLLFLLAFLSWSFSLSIVLPQERYI